jgi:hypothetical protein
MILGCTNKPANNISVTIIPKRAPVIGFFLDFIQK